MIECIKYSIGGNREVLQALFLDIGCDVDIKEYPARSRAIMEVVGGSELHRRLEQKLVAGGLQYSKFSTFEATKEELRTSAFLSCECIPWIDFNCDVSFGASATIEHCSKCGNEYPVSGAYVVADPRAVRRTDIARYPRTIILVSARVSALIQKEEWSGADVLPVVDAGSNLRVSDLFYLRVESRLPPMHESAKVVRSAIPDYCKKCKRLGYELASIQPCYSRAGIKGAPDWNYSAEWVAPHYVSTPMLICSNRVAVALSELDKSIKWVPVMELER